MLKTIFTSLVLTVLFVNGHVSAQNAPTVQVCSGRQVVCLSKTDTFYTLCARVIIDPLYTETIERIELAWGNGETGMVANTTTTSEQFHEYDFRDILTTCVASDRRRITIKTFIVGSTVPEENEIPVTFLSPPRAEFRDFPPTVCVGQETFFADKVCPTGVNRTYDFGEGFTSVPSYTFTELGTFPITIRAENECAADSITRTVTVIDAPVAVARPDSGLVADTAPFNVCRNGDATVRLTSGGSIGIDTYRWTVSGVGGVIENSRRRNTRVTFSRDGIYTVTLRGVNESCNETVDSSFQIEVRSGVINRLTPQPDACESLAYTPDPFLPALEYTVDGALVTNFPVNLGLGQYTVTARLRDPDPFCGDQEPAVDVFRVNPATTAVINATDSTLCDQDVAYRLTANLPGDFWRIDGTPFDGTIDPGSLAPGTYRVSFGDPPCVVADEITVVIVGSAITGATDRELCADDGVIQFNVQPPGGTYSDAAGLVSAGGSFDPGAAGIGEYVVTYRVDGLANLARCSNEAFFTVRVAELVASFAVDDCDGNEVSFSVPDGLTFDRAEWDFAGLGTARGENPTFTFPAAGTYDVTLTVMRGPCVAESVQQITIAPAPAPAFSLTFAPDSCTVLDVAINNQSAAGASLTYNWRLDGVTFSTDPNPGPLQLTAVATPEIYEIELVLNNGCAERTISEAVTVLPTPVASFTTNGAPYCSGDTVAISNSRFAGASSYEWTLNGATVGTELAAPVIVYDTDVVDSINVCLVVSSKCASDTTCERLEISPTEVQAFFGLPGTVCAGDSFDIRSGASAGAGFLYVIDGDTITGAENQRWAFGGPGQYRIEQKVFGKCGVDSYVDSIVVVPSPQAAFAGPVFGCPGEEITFQSQGSGNVDYRWDFGDDSSPQNSAAVGHVFDSSGTYQVCLTVTSLLPDGCSGQQCSTITINAAPVADFTVADSTCLGDPTTFASVAGVGLACTFVFDGGETQDNCAGTYTYPTSGPQTITQVVTDNQTGCRDTLSQPLFIRPLPTPSFDVVTANACNPDSVLFANTTPDATGYRWEFGDGEMSSLTSPVHSYGAPGVYEVQLTASIGGLCTQTVSRSLTINETPVADFTPSATEVCLGETITFTGASGVAITDYAWSFGDGSVGVGTAIDYKYPAAGEYRAQLVVGNGELCSDTLTVPITVNPAVTGQIVQTGEISCFDDAVASLTATAEGGSPDFAYTWSTGDNSATVTDLPAGDYSLTVVDAKGCQTELTSAVAQPARLEAGAVIGRVTCSGGSDGRIEVNVTGGVAPYGITTDSVAVAGPLENLTAGDYEFQISDGNGCLVDRVVTVPEPAPLVVVDSLEQISCFGENDAVLGVSTLAGGTAPYVLSLTGPDYAESGVGRSRFSNLRPGLYAFEVTDSAGCFEIFDLAVIEPDSVGVDIVEDSVMIDLGQSVVLETRFTANASVFEWQPPFGLDCTDCPVPVASPLISRNYFVEITNEFGCTGRDSVYVDVLIDREIFLPSGFTPNGDGRNDVFRVRTKFPDGILQINHFRVFDRWGGLIFERRELPPNEETFGWDGTKGGVAAGLGAYTYQLEVIYVDGERKTITGTVNLIR
ncbi:PKD domain-containing protein [Neolewinella antarctica]|uniref:Gliding motility-associated-like protein n=1 Tax=Neolewinella antarctica TaxID=442734 RepID=A0ABX0X9S0_9BACT|nr:PKD domain-containing protein [Neolewinella antarctica]NJC25760.1 gliding motility-associated-like protein [Neolewinella antarctica]